MSKTGIISILLCAGALAAALLGGGATQHPYVKDLTQELRQAGAIVKPKNPDANQAQTHAAVQVSEVQSPRSLDGQAADEQHSDAPLSIEKSVDDPQSNALPLEKSLLDKPQQQALEYQHE